MHNKLSVFLLIILTVAAVIAYNNGSKDRARKKAIAYASYALVGRANHSRSSEADVTFDRGVYTVRFPVTPPPGEEVKKAWYEVIIDGRTYEAVSIELVTE